MNVMARQLRNGMKKVVSINKSKITVYRKPMTTDPITGELVIDPTGDNSEVNIVCRVTHERSQVPTNEQTPAGLSTNLQRMIISDHKNEIKEGDTFTWKGYQYEIDAVDKVIQFDEIIGYQGVLKETMDSVEATS